jgi:hypothetical protein
MMSRMSRKQKVQIERVDELDHLGILQSCDLGIGTTDRLRPTCGQNVLSGEKRIVVHSWKTVLTKSSGNNRLHAWAEDLERKRAYFIVHSIVNTEMAPAQRSLKATCRVMPSIWARATNIHARTVKKQRDH